MPEITADIACTLDLPVHCASCGLHKSADSWCLSEDVDSRTLEELSDAPTILVVAPPPRKQDDKIGRIMTGPPGDFLREFLAHLDCKWVIMPATRCYAGKNDIDGLDIIPTSKQLTYCASNYLPYIASTYSPSVIVCLGHHALRAVMGDDCPATINAALKSSFRPDHLGGKTWVLATYDPVNHTSGRKDLRDDYFKVFLKAEELARRDYVTEVPFSYLAYEDSTSALRKLDEFIDRESVYFDVEVSQCDLDPDKKTMWHPGSRLLSCSLTFPYHTQESASGHGIAYDTIVLHGDALNATVIRKAIANKYVVAHNLKYDANALYRFLDVCVFTEAKGYKDTIFDFYLRDQAKMGNSLKQLSEDMLGAVKWDSKIWDHIDSRNNEIRRQMAAANRANGKIIRNIRKVIDKLPEGPRKASWIKMLENPPTEIRDGFSYITIPMHPFQGKLPPFTPVPLQNADFGDVPLADLLPYNARDTYWDARLGEEVIPRFAEAERANPDTVDFLLRSSYALARIERKGLPFDKKRMLALRAATAAKIEQLTSLLLKQPEVHEALRLMQEGSKNPPALITPDMLNVKSFIFYEALVQSTGAPTPEKTPSGRLSSSKDVLKELAGVNPLVEDKDKTRRHWIFTYFLALRQARDMISKFINSYLGYLVKDELGMDRIHTDFRLTRVEGAGRGSGADDMEGGAGCVTGDTLIWTDFGLLPISSFFNGTEKDGQFVPAALGLPVYDVESGKLLPYSADATYKHQSDTYSITTELGLTLTGTPNHPVLTKDGWKRLDTILVGDRVSSPLHIPTPQRPYVTLEGYSHQFRTNSVRVTFPSVLDENLGRFLGYYQADGSQRGNNGCRSIRINNSSEEILEDVKSILFSLFSVECKIVRTSDNEKYIYTPSAITDFINYHFDLQCGVESKTIPDKIKRSPDSVIWSYLGGLSQDSHYYRDRPRIRMITCNEQSVIFTHQFLLSQGIICSLTEGTSSIGISPRRTEKKTPTKHHYKQFKLTISGIAAIHAARRINSVAYKHRSALAKWDNLPTIIPNPNVLVRDGIAWPRVKSIRHNPAMTDVYDLHVPKYHSFIAGGIVNHNTGRLSSSSPNLQNLPGNDAFKSCIIAPPGKLFLECDFSTGEPVILTHVAGIQKWKEVFEEGIDLYKYISTQIPFLKCPTLESVTPEVRKEIKTETLAIMYDEQAVSFARRTGIPELQAIEFFKQFTSAFPEIDVWKQAVKASVARGEMLTTLFGRKRSFQLKGDHGFDNGVLRQAINFPIQSSLSDITLWKLYEVFQWIDSWDVADKIHPVNTVHDSIWFEVDHKEGLELVQAISEIMQDMTTLPFKMEIPLRISFKIGRDLGHMKEYKTWDSLAEAWDKA